MVRDVAGDRYLAVGRYVIGPEIASGGMATVHLGRMVGPGGFARIVAIKRLHACFAKDPEFVSMFLDEARLAARAPHPNVVSVLDVVASDGELFLVMEYVRGESVAGLGRAATPAAKPVAVGIALGVIAGVLSGLHAAHEAKTESGEPLGIVHRDVSPQNVLVGVDGVARVLDFGIAKAKYRLHSTKDGRLKGKLRYMAPEQLRRDDVDRRGDVYSASAVLWEMLTGRPLFDEEDHAVLVKRILETSVVSLRTLQPSLPEALDRIVLRGLASRPEDRFPTALAMAEALETVGAAATPREIGAWVVDTAARALAELDANMLALEASERQGESNDANANPARPRADSRLDTQLVVRGGGETASPALLFGAPEEAPGTEHDRMAPVTPQPQRRRRVVVGVVATVAAVALTTCALVASTSRTTVRPSIASSVSAITPAPLESATEPAVASSFATEPALPSLASSVNTPPRAAAAPKHPRVARPARPGCDPPYFIDSDGHKQYHAKCL
jgi:eukaryotic-like serine/threonine-protein kinase